MSRQAHLEGSERALRVPRSGVFERGHAGPHEVEAVLRSADDARARGVPFHRWARLGAPLEWRTLSVRQRLAIEALVWGALGD